MAKHCNMVMAVFLAELLGTFLLVLIGDGTIAAHVLTRQNIDLFVSCMAFGVGLLIATLVSARISGAHLNPAATLAFALDGQVSWALVPVYVCAQYLGGFLAALVLYVNYYDAIKALEAGNLTVNGTGKIFATYPGPWIESVWPALLDQLLGTAVLLFSLTAVADKQNSGPEQVHQCASIAAVVLGFVCIAFSPNCGAIFNPARDLAPRLLTWVFGYSSVWSPVGGYYWLVAGVLGPHVGAIVGLFAYRFIIGCPLRKKRQLELDMSATGAGGGQQAFKMHEAGGMATNNYGSSSYAMQ